MTRLHPHDSELMARIIDKLNQDLRYPLSLGMLTTEFALSATRLKKLFKILHDQTFYQYYTQLRMEAAADMLIKREKTIDEIAFFTGFTSISTFCRRFRQYYGVKPIQYRNNHTPPKAVGLAGE
ncbi:MAG: AraC family transcriptional regulator [Candidatus Pseudobacter hemicellulosilyticus]|uniref:AraC family transcriptional regulator n=1 Tax=Candidatus Pseudobacter hemicellulosilyticus TaxID=3121375 RepID=A0AAJ5WSU0_9BACT|nr:MAG: AraC family transcriptional regulator [Pseudobacter sp.]